MSGALRLPRPCLMLVVDPQACALPLRQAVGEALAGGVDLVQLRAPGRPSDELLALAEELRSLVRPPALFVVNDRIDVAAACGADGVHLPEAGLPVAAARGVLGPAALVGRSVHSPEAARAAQDEGADYLVVGTIFATGSHPGQAPAGPALISHVRGVTTLPLLAIGGITAGHVPQVVAAGADGVAVMTAILGSPEPRAASSEMKEALVVCAGRPRNASPPASPPPLHVRGEGARG